VDTDIIVSPAHIELDEIVCTLEVMDQVINERKGVVIFACDGVEGAVVLDEV
jgi:hypothetical protein